MKYISGLSTVSQIIYENCACLAGQGMNPPGGPVSKPGYFHTSGLIYTRFIANLASPVHNKMAPELEYLIDSI
jgi:hypothetical protein